MEGEAWLKLNIFTYPSCYKRYWQNEDSSTQVNNTEMLDQDKADHPRLDITLADIENDAAIGDNSDQEDDYDHKALKWLG